MNLTDNLLGETWYWAAWLVWIPLFAHSVWRAPWKRLVDSEQSNLWLGLIVALVLLWTMKASAQEGLSLHLLGANVFTLVFGPHLALVGLAVVLLCTSLNDGGAWFSYAANALLLAGVGVALSHGLFRLLAVRLPRNYFIYIFVNAFLCGGAVILGVGLVSTLLLGLGGAYPLPYLFEEYLPYFLLLAFSEAWLSGGVLTVFVIYRPHWVGSFDDAHYIFHK